MADYKQKMLAFLLAQPEVVGLVGNRVWAGHREPPESADYKPSDGPAICFAADGGQGNYNHNVASMRFMFRCFGSGQTDANELYEVLFPLLFGVDSKIKRGEHKIFNTDLESGPVDQHMTETDWPHVLFFMRARMFARG